MVYAGGPVGLHASCLQLKNLKAYLVERVLERERERERERELSRESVLKSVLESTLANRIAIQTARSVLLLPKSAAHRYGIDGFSQNN